MEGLKMGYTIYFWYLYGEMRSMHVFFLGTWFSDKAICSGFNGNFNWAVAANPLWFMIIGRYYDTIQSIGNGHHPVRVASVLNQGGHNSPPPVPWMPLDALGKNRVENGWTPICSLPWSRGVLRDTENPWIQKRRMAVAVATLVRKWGISIGYPTSVISIGDDQSWDSWVPKSLPQSHWMFEGFWRMECRILGPFLGLSGRGATRRSAYGWHPTVFFFCIQGHSHHWSC